MENINTDNIQVQNEVAEVGGGLVGDAAANAAKQAMAASKQEANTILNTGEIKATVKEIEGLEKAQATSDKAHAAGEVIRDIPDKVADGVHAVAETVAHAAAYIPHKVADVVAGGVAKVVETTGDAIAHAKEHHAERKAEHIREHAAKEASHTLEAGKELAKDRVEEILEHAKQAGEIVYEQEMHNDGTLATPIVPHVEL